MIKMIYQISKYGFLTVSRVINRSVYNSAVSLEHETATQITAARH